MVCLSSWIHGVRSCTHRFRVGASKISRIGLVDVALGSLFFGINGVKSLCSECKPLQPACLRVNPPHPQSTRIMS